MPTIIVNAVNKSPLLIILSQNKHKEVLDGEVQASASFDNLTFDLLLNNEDVPFTASVGVVYDDLLSTLPSQVYVNIRG